MARILVVDDCPDVMPLVQAALPHPHELIAAESLARARARLAEGGIDLALVDLGLPDGSGFTLCSELEAGAARSAVPVLFVSASSNVSDKVAAFRLGAEDYIEKPFDARELRARVEARLARRPADAAADALLPVGDLRLDRRGFAAHLERDGRRIALDLTPHELRILCHLAEHRGRVVSRQSILEAVWGGVAVVPRTVDTHLSNVRAKLRGSSVAITPVRGVGYRLELRDPDGVGEG